MHKPSNPFTEPCEALFDAAFWMEGARVPERLERMDEAHAFIGQLLVAEWQREHVSHGALFGATMAACSPSFDRVARGQRHSQENAQEISLNFQKLAVQLSEKDVIADPSDRLVGRLSETAVLSTFWWGIAHGPFAPDSYALPTSQAQDSSTESGRRTGVDIIFRDHNHAHRHFVQVKTSRNSATAPHKSNSYAKHIAVVTPGDLLNASYALPALKKIYKGLADNDEYLMEQASGNLSLILRRIKHVRGRHEVREPQRRPQLQAPLA